MALAVACLGEARREWARAMEAELEAAQEGGEACGFALGCLFAAVRELPAHEEGRFAVAVHALAFLLVLPAAAFLLSSLLGGFPLSWLGQETVLTAANLFAVPPLAMLVLALAALQLRLAWLVVERDWVRIAPVAASTAAATAALAIFSAVVFADVAAAVTFPGAVALELGAVAALARRHAAAAARPLADARLSG